jgi:integrase
MRAKMRAKLTASTIQKIALPEGEADVFCWDTELKGFALRLREGGSRTFVYRYWTGAKEVKLALGPATAESFKTAKGPDGVVLKLGIREQVAQLIARVKLGESPAEDKHETRRRAAETLKEMSAKFLAVKRGSLRPNSYRHVNRHINAYAKPLHQDGLASIKRRQLSDLLDGVLQNNGLVAANRFYTTLSEFFAWSLGKGYLDVNPMVGIPKFEGEKKRDRVLDDNELRLIWNCCDPADHYGAVVRLLLLTGQRANEIANLRWLEIQGDTIALPGERTKNGAAHVVPLSAPALEILRKQPRRVSRDGTLRQLVFGERGYGFSGWSRSKLCLDQRIAQEVGIPLPHWVVHDLRRSAATGMSKLGVPPHAIEMVLNHRSGFKAGVGGVYIRANYEAEKRDALNRWAEHVMSIVTSEGAAASEAAE